MVVFLVFQLHVEGFYLAKDELVFKYLVPAFLHLVFLEFGKIHLLNLLTDLLINLLASQTVQVAPKVHRSSFHIQPQHTLVLQILFSQGRDFPGRTLISFVDVLLSHIGLGRLFHKVVALRQHQFLQLD